MYLAVIETQKDNDNLQEDSICRLYEVGSVKTDEEMVSNEFPLPLSEDLRACTHMLPIPYSVTYYTSCSVTVC